MTVRAVAYALPVRGLAVAMLTALACLAFAAAQDTRTLSLQRVAGSSLLMSCAETTPVSAEPLWCSDPSSPHCLPAAPHAPRPELRDHPDLSLVSEHGAPGVVVHILSTWPRPSAESPRGRSYVERLERPPRA